MQATMEREVAFEDEFLAIEEAAKRYGRSRDTLDRLARAGRLKKHKAAGDKRVYLRIAELDQVLRPQPMDDL
jgi:excisionase family DNA binding protein